MKLCFNTDGLGDMPFEEMLDTLAGLGYESIEIACGNWSKAPHIHLDEMLESEQARKTFLEAIQSRGLQLEALNCSGNQLAPNDEGKQHQEVVEKTFRLAGLLGVKKIVMMSGCPGGSPEDKTPNWIITSWPPITTQILNWQWNEVLIPYWKETVARAKANGIEKIALENHGCQMVYNPETLIRLRDAVDPMIGMNLDPPTSCGWAVTPSQPFISWVQNVFITFTPKMYVLSETMLVQTVFWIPKPLTSLQNVPGTMLHSVMDMTCVGGKNSCLC